MADRADSRHTALPSALLQLGNPALNRALDYAPAARARLQILGPQCWRLHLEDLGWSLDVQSDGQRLRLDHPDDSVPDAEVRGASRDFLALLRSDDRTAALASLPIRVEGSTRSFMQLQGLAEDLDIDWEAWLGDHIGDLPAHHLARIGRQAGSAVHGGLSGLQRATERYLIRELGWLVTRSEANQLRDDAQALRRRLDRLEQQAMQLRKDCTHRQQGD
ncbi:hypothetical protein E4656_09420 [Natronospirillum operosum]|uniref:SCP2 domain-containing protein n=1 Tax=Natronospirillum operosum TaxID=2759953 RepID=A0A4Z0W7B6_9GAMM|nr:SCP2 sterol-binding domain-containing protein [Natronospirillum operosum]TGG93267.1 hypothetical protein E4656_09420 [Natronospirillum operosum]